MPGADTRLVASYGVAIAFDVLMPVMLVLWARRRWDIPWKVIGVGVLTFAVSQLFTRVPLVQGLQYLLREPLKNSKSLQDAWIIAMAFTAGLFEETARLLAFRYPLRESRRWRDAVGFGLGHGGLESAVVVAVLGALGLVNVVVLSRMDLSTLTLPAEQLEQIRAAQAQVAAMRWWEPLLGAYERLGAMVIHVAMSVLVLQRFLRGERRWYWLAVGLHTLFNVVAVMVARAAGPLAAEGCVTVFALGAVWLTWRLRSD